MSDKQIKAVAEVLSRAHGGDYWEPDGFDDLEPEDQIMYRDWAKAAIAAIVPPGHVVVPREPTEDMLDAGCRPPVIDDSYGHQFADSHAVWQAMLAAAEKDKP